MKLSLKQQVYSFHVDKHLTRPSHIINPLKWRNGKTQHRLLQWRQNAKVAVHRLFTALQFLLLQRLSGAKLLIYIHFPLLNICTVSTSHICYCF